MPVVQLIKAWPQHWSAESLMLDEGATVGDALAAAGIVLPAGDFVAVALHGTVARSSQVLEEGDRLELLRPLVADPKENRRKRARGGI